MLRKIFAVVLGLLSNQAQAGWLSPDLIINLRCNPEDVSTVEDAFLHFAESHAFRAVNRTRKTFELGERTPFSTEVIGIRPDLYIRFMKTGFREGDHTIAYFSKPPQRRDDKLSAAIREFAESQPSCTVIGEREADLGGGDLKTFDIWYENYRNFIEKFAM